MEKLMEYISEYLNNSCSDKQKAHRYGTFYDMVFSVLFQAIQCRPLNVLEIGVSKFSNRNGKPGSGHAFSEFPLVKKFVGIDTMDLDMPFSKKGVFIQSDAYSDEALKQIKVHAPFHILIDDGSHRVDSQVYFLKNYAEFRAPNSAIICEDVGKDNIQKIITAVKPRLDLQHFCSRPFEPWHNQWSNLLFSIQYGG